MRVVIDAERRAILDPHSRRALDLREQQISLILQPADFESPAGDRAVLDFGTIVIGHKLATTDLAKHLPLVGQRSVLLEAADKQIGGTPINRHAVDVGARSRAVDHGLVVAGDETLVLPDPRDPQRQKMLFEKAPRFGVIPDAGRFGRAAGNAQRDAQGFWIGGGGVLVGYGVVMLSAGLSCA